MNKNVLIGFPESAGGYSDGTSIAGVAAVHEFGSDTVDERPFLRPTVNENQELISELLSDGVAEVIESGGDIDTALDAVGLRISGLVKEKIESIESPTLSPKTVAARKKRTGRTSTKPLIDTGAMLQAVTYVVTAENIEEGI